MTVINTKDYKIVGERIHELRISKGKTLTDLAEEIGYTDQTALSKIESGKRGCPRSKLSQIAYIFDVDLMYFLEGTVEGKKYQRELERYTALRKTSNPYYEKEQLKEKTTGASEKASSPFGTFGNMKSGGMSFNTMSFRTPQQDKYDKVTVIQELLNEVFGKDIEITLDEKDKRNIDEEKNPEGILYYIVYFQGKKIKMTSDDFYYIYASENMKKFLAAQLFEVKQHTK